jgi:hypothetical protein
MLPAEIRYWAEGPTDRAAARKLIVTVGGRPGADYSERRSAASGKDRLDQKLPAFNAAARYAPWLILRDGDGECAVELAKRLLPRPAAGMCLRIVVPAIEAWLLADREAMAALLGVDGRSLPFNPENEIDPKQSLLNLVRRSARRPLHDDFLPRARSGRREGPAYAQRLIEFIVGPWCPQRAAARAPSLKRALERIAALRAKGAIQ